MKRFIYVYVIVLCILSCCLTATAQTQLSNQFQLTQMSSQKAQEIYRILDVRRTSVEYSGHELISGFDVDQAGRIAISVPCGKYSYFNIYDAEMQFSYSILCKLQGTVVLLFSEDPDMLFLYLVRDECLLKIDSKGTLMDAFSCDLKVGKNKKAFYSCIDIGKKIRQGDKAYYVSNYLFFDQLTKDKSVQFICEHNGKISVVYDDGGKTFYFHLFLLATVVLMVVSVVVIFYFFFKRKNQKRKG